MNSNVKSFAFALCPFSLSQPAPRGTVGAPFQRATPTRRAPPGAVGTLPPPPGRPVVPGLLWAHYMPALCRGRHFTTCTNCP